MQFDLIMDEKIAFSLKITRFKRPGNDELENLFDPFPIMSIKRDQ